MTEVMETGRGTGLGHGKSKIERRWSGEEREKRKRRKDEVVFDQAHPPLLCAAMAASIQDYLDNP